MRSVFGVAIDLSLLLVATLFAFLLRENFEPSIVRLSAALPYFAGTMIAAAVILPLASLNRTFWRFSAMHDYVRVCAATLLIVGAAVALTFAFNRLDGIARALPILQCIVGVGMLVGARVVARLQFAARQSRKVPIVPLSSVFDSPKEFVLVAGLSPLTEVYLRSVNEFAVGHIEVAGLLGRSDRHLGRYVGTHKVLGLPEDVEEIVADLQLHGVYVDRVVVTIAFDTLGEEARAALLRIEQSGSIELQFLAERLGFDRSGGNTSSETQTQNDGADSQFGFEISHLELAAIGRRRYWLAKRLFDVFASAVLIVLAAPLMLVISLLVAASIGLPVAFWQQRPGLGGRPFRLYKFRTMASAHTPDGQRISDEARASVVGKFLRRTRFDELPQLFNILWGHMSFVGPRPLLPRDQPDSFRARLLVRPGLTGWAQVVGGRDISAADKAALDIWYVRNASLWMDLTIAARTIPVILFGERKATSMISLAWRELREAGILRDDTGHTAGRNARTAA